MPLDTILEKSRYVCWLPKAFLEQQRGSYALVEVASHKVIAGYGDAREWWVVWDAQGRRFRAPAEDFHADAKDWVERIESEVMGRIAPGRKPSKAVFLREHEREGWFIATDPRPRADTYPNDFRVWTRIRFRSWIFYRLGYGKFIGNFAPIWVQWRGRKVQLEDELSRTMNDEIAQRLSAVFKVRSVAKAD